MKQLISDLWIIVLTFSFPCIGASVNYIHFQDKNQFIQSDGVFFLAPGNSSFTNTIKTFSEEDVEEGENSKPQIDYEKIKKFLKSKDPNNITLSPNGLFLCPNTSRMSGNKLIIIVPDPNINYVITLIKPDPNIDYK